MLVHLQLQLNGLSLYPPVLLTWTQWFSIGTLWCQRGLCRPVASQGWQGQAPLLNLQCSPLLVPCCPLPFPVSLLLCWLLVPCSPTSSASPQHVQKAHMSWSGSMDQESWLVGERGPGTATWRSGKLAGGASLPGFWVAMTAEEPLGRALGIPRQGCPPNVPPTPSSQIASPCCTGLQVRFSACVQLLQLSGLCAATAALWR